MDKKKSPHAEHEDKAVKYAESKHHAHRWTTIAALAFAVLILTIVLTMVMHVKKTHDDQAAAKLVAGMVVVNKDGFMPQTISIKKGQAILWTNRDTAPHQVAADPYPQDSSLPGLSSNGPLLENESYAYTFDKAGTYTYHDDKNPLSLTGTVIVTE
jgi:plastocyanin